ncbi:MAG: GTP-binding protein [Candidatus Thorarchaeota archaeon]|nr:GTP-binding protein [Candidatus Thorarchaeota archaeon]
MSGIRRRQFKICLIGDGYVGKTSIRRKYLKEGFKRSYIPTLGVDFAQMSIDFEGVLTNLVIWDIAGQSLFQNLRKRYYDGSSGIVLVYNVTDRTSFDSASKWLVEAHGYMGNLPPLIIVGNKTDLRPSNPEGEVVTTEEGEEFSEKICNDLNATAIFIETSALTGANIEEAFSSLVGMMIEEYKKRQPGYIPEEKTPILAEEKVEEVQQLEAYHLQSNEEVTVSSSTDNDVSSSQIGTVTPIASIRIDSVTLLPSDSEYLKEDKIGKAMTELNALRLELKLEEDGLANISSDLEGKLLSLRNIIHVKKIMYEHLRTQLSTTRQEWTEAYDEYSVTDKIKKEEMAERAKKIEDIRSKIDRIGRIVRQRVGDLEMKKMTD